MSDEKEKQKTNPQDNILIKNKVQEAATQFKNESGEEIDDKEIEETVTDIVHILGDETDPTSK